MVFDGYEYNLAVWTRWINIPGSIKFADQDQLSNLIAPETLNAKILETNCQRWEP